MTAPPTPHKPLSPRQVEIALLLAEGMGTKQIAARLGISRFTVRATIKQAAERFPDAGEDDILPQIKVTIYGFWLARALEQQRRGDAA